MPDQRLTENVEAVSRRSFAGAVLGAAAIALLPAGAAGESKDVPVPEADLGVRPEGLSASDWDEVRSRYSNLLRVYGTRLSPAERRRTAHILTTNQYMLASIRSFVVQNGDPSACTLRIFDPKQQPTAR